MAKTKKQTAPWLVLLESVGLALGVYLGGLALLAALAVRGGVGEGAVFPVLAALCLVASLGGGLLSARRLPWGTLPSALLAVGCFAGVLALVSAVLFALIPYDKMLMIALMLQYTLPAPFIIPLFADLGEDGEYVSTTLSMGTLLTAVLFPLIAAFSLM